MLKSCLKSNTVIIILLLFAFSSCKKFDEGVNFSLRSKKKRIINTWEYAYIVDLSNGSKQTAGLNGWSEKFEKNGKYIKTINYIGNVTVGEGNWTYDNKKKLVIGYHLQGEDFQEEYEIIRLANDEMKIRNNTVEKFFRSN